MPTTIPLCVDLDGTLVRGDVLRLSVASLLKKRPLSLIEPSLMIWKGRARFKKAIAERFAIEPSELELNAELLEFLRKEKSAGRTLILVTGADRAPAQRVASHSGLFLEIIASDGTRNLTGPTKARELARRFGEKNFDYAGDSWTDLPVWEKSRKAIVVSRDARLIARVASIAAIEAVFE